MRRSWAGWVFALGIGSALGAAAYVVGGTHRIELRQTTVPGTGVSLGLPEGVTASPLGPTFVNADASILVAVSTGPAANSPANSEVFKRLFPASAESFHTATLEGTLRHRTRKSDGGGWDGWWLIVVRGDRMLQIQISYQGKDEKSFGELKQILDTVSWDEHTLDPEAAFGLKINPPGLQLVPGATGALAYSADGRPGTSEPNLYLSAIPIRSKGDPETFHRLCEKTAPLAFKGALPAPLQYVRANGLSLCDTWGGPGLTGSDYFAAIEFPDGAVVTTWGRGEPQSLRQSLLDVRRISR